MSIRHLRIFIAVYQEKSITKAAEKLHLAQPSVSLAIKELEEEYKIKLFDRINRKIYVTEKGENFYEYTSHIIQLFDEMENAMRSPEAPFLIRLGSSITIGNFIVPQIVSQFQKKHENGKVKVSIQNSKQIIQGVIKNDIDIGLVEDQIKEESLIAIPFMKDELCFICNASHPLAQRKSLSFEEVSDYPFYMREPGSASREIADGLFKSHMLKMRIIWESVCNESILQALKKNEGITVMSKRLANRELQKGTLVELPLMPEVFQRDFSMIYRKNKYMTPALNEFKNLLLSYSNEME